MRRRPKSMETVSAVRRRRADRMAVRRAERKGRNPQTGEEMIIPAVNTVKFKPSSALKEAVK